MKNNKPTMRFINPHSSLLLHIQKLKEDAMETPEQPGVYIHYNEEKKVLYVGKAINLRKRLLSYFNRFEHLPLKTKSLVSKIYTFEVVLTDNEDQALILENQLIKKYQPPYNILLRDDKSYPYIKLDITKKWPSIQITYRKQQDDSLYFGPYPKSKQAYELVRIIQNHTQLIRCSPNVFKTVARPCVYYEIGACRAPCHLPVEPELYQQDVQMIKNLLTGQSSELADRIECKMYKAAEHENYEKAAQYRDEWLILKDFKNQKRWELPSHFNAILWSFRVIQDTLLMYLTEIQNGVVLNGHFIFGSDSHLMDASDNTWTDYIIQLLRQVLPSSPPLLLGIWLQNPSKETVEKKLSKNLKTTCLIWGSAEFEHWKENTFKPEEYASLDYLKEQNQLNLEHHCDSKKSQIEEWSLIQKDLQSILKSSLSFNWIEGYDIATFQGQHTVGSQVVFRDGSPCPQQYRLYKIQDEKAQTNDFDSLVEVIGRRMQQKIPLPDLMLIDGGQPQLKALIKSIPSSRLNKTHLVGIAKQREQTSKYERLVIWDTQNQDFITYPLESQTPLFRLMTQIRNEAHRKANQYHNKRRTQHSLQNVFMTLTQTEKKRLLATCSNLSTIDLWDAEELSKLTKIPVEKIKKLQKDPKKESSI